MNTGRGPARLLFENMPDYEPPEHIIQPKKKGPKKQASPVVQGASTGGIPLDNSFLACPGNGHTHPSDQPVFLQIMQCRKVCVAFCPVRSCQARVFFYGQGWYRKCVNADMHIGITREEILSKAPRAIIL